MLRYVEQRVNIIIIHQGIGSIHRVDIEVTLQKVTEISVNTLQRIVRDIIFKDRCIPSLEVSIVVRDKNILIIHPNITTSQVITEVSNMDIRGILIIHHIEKIVI